MSEHGLSPTVLLASPTPIVGVSAGARAHELLVTVHSQGVSLYDTRTQACTHTWLTRAGVQLTHAACVHPSTGRLICVRDHVTLFGWAPDGEIDFDKNVQTVAAPVLSVVHDSKLLDGVVAVQIDGSADIFDGALSRCIAHVPAPSSSGAQSARAVWAALLPLPAAHGSPLALALLMQDESHVTLHVQPLALQGSGMDARAAPLRSVSFPAPPPPLRVARPAAAVADNPVIVKGSRAARAAAAPPPPPPPPELAGCCLLHAESGEGVGLGAHDATLCLLWTPAILEVYRVETTAAAGALGGDGGAAAPPRPRVRRHIRGTALGSAADPATSFSAPTPRRPNGSGRLAVAPGSRVGSIGAPPLPCALQPLRSPAVLLVTCDDGAGTHEPAAAAAPAAPATPATAACAAAADAPASGASAGGGGAPAISLDMQTWDTAYGLLHHRRAFDLAPTLQSAEALGGGVDARLPRKRSGTRGANGLGWPAEPPPPPVGACVCGDGEGVALAYRHLVLTCRLERQRPFCLADALGAKQRTASVLAEGLGGGGGGGAAADRAAAPPLPGMRAAAVPSAAATALLSSAAATGGGGAGNGTAPLIPPPCRAQLLDGLLSLRPSRAVAYGPQPLPASAFEGWREQEATEARQEEVALEGLLAAGHTPATFEAALRAHLSAVADCDVDGGADGEAAVRATHQRRSHTATVAPRCSRAATYACLGVGCRMGSVPGGVVCSHALAAHTPSPLTRPRRSHALAARTPSRLTRPRRSHALAARTPSPLTRPRRSHALAAHTPSPLARPRRSRLWTD